MSRRGWVAYGLCPIDYFQGVMSLAEYLDSIEGDVSERQITLLNYGRALWAMQKEGWEGDIIEGPYILPVLPDGGMPNFHIAFLLKQSNNGTTYLASPCELPWLRDWNGC